MGFGLFAVGPITVGPVIKAAQDAISSGEKIYVSQVDYLAGETGNQVAGYLSQYAASEHWIPRSKASWCM